MRDNYDKFEQAGAVVVAVSQDDEDDVNEYFNENNIPFICLPDPDSNLKNLYQQQSKFGPIPALFIIDQEGTLVLSHYGEGMGDIPTTEDILKMLPAKQ